MKLLLAILFSLLSTILCGQENVALSKTATASTAIGGNTASNVTNGTTTGDRWESTQGLDNQWIQIDLGSVYDLTSSKIYWEGASAKSYEVEVSSNNETWRTIAQKESTVGARTDEFTFSTNAQLVRYIRLNLKTRTTIYGFSIYEWQVYGIPSGSDTSVATSMDIKPKNAMLLAEMPEELKILSLNNSLIYNNDMDNIFNQLVLSAGKKATWTKQTRLGQSLRYHYEESDGAELSAKTVVSSKAWTHIILQEQSSKPIDDYTDFLASVKLWVQYVKNYCPNPNARIIVMMNWPYITSTDYAGDYQKLYDSYMAVAEELGIIICPAATSYNLVRTTDGDEAKLYTDNRHPSVLASYLSACTFYSTFFNASPIGLSYYPSNISAQDATRMQTRAWSAYQSHDGVVNDINGTIKYKVNVLDQFNRKMDGSFTYQWSSNGGGSISNGIFTTNKTKGTYNITAQTGALSTSTTLNVVTALEPLPDTYFIEMKNGDEYLQDFNSIGTTATATLPNGWKIEKRIDAPRTLGTFSGASLQTEQIGGNSLSTSTPNGIYNFGAGVAASATDRAIGGVSTGVAGGTRCVNIYLKIKNNGSTDIKSLDIEYDIEKYRKGINAAGFVMQMYYSTDGSTWVSAGDNFKTLFSADSEAGGYTTAPGDARHISSNLLQNIKNGEYLYLAWNYSVASGTDPQAAQALSIDNVKIKTSNTEVVDFASLDFVSTYSQNFNSIGTTATATLPLGWKIEKRLDSPRKLGSYASASSQTEQIGGNSLSATTTNGTYNFGAGNAATATDRAIGGVSTGIANATRCVNIYLKIRNTGTIDVNSFDIKYDVEKYRKGLNAAGFVFQMYYSTDGETWTSAGNDFNTFFSADTETAGYATAPGATRSVSENLPLSLNAGANLFLAWNYSVASGTDPQAAQALALDNFEIKANNTTVSLASDVEDDVSLSFSNHQLKVVGKGDKNITLYNINGIKIKALELNNTFDMSPLSSGIYIVKVNNKVYKIIN